jgi:imidazolonepropionase-like amidohydrolase
MNVPAETILLKHAIVHTVSGQTLSPGDVLIENGKITAVAASVDSAGAKIVDLTGQHLYPGLIALDSAQGLFEIESVRATIDTTEIGDYKPDIQSWVAVNPDSELLPVTRANGITHIEPAPQGGIVAGVSGLMQLDGWTTEQMTIKHPVALHIYWPDMALNTGAGGGGRGGAGGGGARGKSLPDQAKDRQMKLKELDDFFQEARAYAKAHDAAKPGAASSVNPPWEAMLPVIHGDIPIMVHASDLRQIKAAVKWAQTNNYRVILVGGHDAALAAGLLAEQKIPVIYEVTYAPAGRDSEGYDVNFGAPEILRQAGVTVAFSCGASAIATPIAKNLPYDAAQCVAFGYPEDEAVKGLTLYPAQILGVSGRLGSIEVGKEASLVAYTGSVLDIRAVTKHVWIAGNEVSLESRHTRLYEKYQARPLPAK